MNGVIIVQYHPLINNKFRPFRTEALTTFTNAPSVVACRIHAWDSSVWSFSVSSPENEIPCCPIVARSQHRRIRVAASRSNLARGISPGEILRPRCRATFAPHAVCDWPVGAPFPLSSRGLVSWIGGPCGPVAFGGHRLPSKPPQRGGAAGALRLRGAKLVTTALFLVRWAGTWGALEGGVLSGPPITGRSCASWRARSRTSPPASSHVGPLVKTPSPSLLNLESSPLFSPPPLCDVRHHHSSLTTWPSL